MVVVANKPTNKILREIKLFSVFTDQEINQLLTLGKPVAYEAFANIVIEGEATWGLYLILDGTVGITKYKQIGGNAYDIGQLTSGSFFGEMSLIDENPRSATVRALTDCQLYYLSKESFNNFLNTSGERRMRFYDSCIRNLVARLRELNDNYVISQYQLWKTALLKKGEAA